MNPVYFKTKLLLLLTSIAACGTSPKPEPPDAAGGGTGGATSISPCDPGCNYVCQADVGCECDCGNATGGTG